MERTAEDRDELALVRKLCPHFSERELREAQERWLAYVRLVARTAERLADEPRTDADMTESEVAENGKIIRHASASGCAIIGSYEHANPTSPKEGPTS